MKKFDSSPLRQLYGQLGVVPSYTLPPLAVRGLQRQQAKGEPDALAGTIERLRDMALVSGDELKIGAFEFSIGLDFLDVRGASRAVEQFESARRQWQFVNHLPLLALAYFGKGLAHYSAGEHRRAAAAYFRVKQYLKQVEEDPVLLEEWEQEQSLRPFWQGMERWLRLALRSLQRDFAGDLKQHLLSTHMGGSSPVTTGGSAGPTPGSLSVRIEMRIHPGPPFTAAQLRQLLCATAEAIERMSTGFARLQGLTDFQPPLATAINYADDGPLRVEFANVSAGVIGLWNWLDTQMLDTPERVQPMAQEETDIAEDVRMPAGREVSHRQPGSPPAPERIAAMLEYYLRDVFGHEVELDEIRRIVHAAEYLIGLRADHQLTLNHRML